MRKFLLLLFILFVILPANSTILTGEVKYNHENARQETFQAPIQPISFEFISRHFIDSNNSENLNAIASGITELKDKKVARFSDSTYGIIYYDDPAYAWYYTNNGRLVNFTKRENQGYPSKITKFKPDGSIANTGIKLSEHESYIFNLGGELIAHWVGEFCYDKNNRIIMKRKIN